jgi:hypothetical protein
MLQVSKAFDIGRAIRHGWAAFQRQPLGLLFGSLVLTLTEGGGSNPGSGSFQSSDDDAPTLPNMPEVFDVETAAGIAAVAVGVTCLLLCVAAVLLFRTWIEAGYIRMQRDLVVAGQASAGTIFGGAPDLGRLLLWKLLSMTVFLGVITVALLPALAGGLVAYALHAEKELIFLLAGLLAFVFALPTLVYVGIGLAFGSLAVVVDGLGAAAALDRSWSLAKGNRMPLFVFFLVTGLFRLSGFLLCCVGIFATRAIADTGTTESYMLATQSGSEDWALSKESA